MFVTTRKKPTPPNAGRKSAYVARNRAALLRATQQLLAEVGPDASIDQFAIGVPHLIVYRQQPGGEICVRKERFLLDHALWFQSDG
mgnify:CR=1 FL=1